MDPCREPRNQEKEKTVSMKLEIGGGENETAIVGKIKDQMQKQRLVMGVNANWIDLIPALKYEQLHAQQNWQASFGRVA